MSAESILYDEIFWYEAFAFSKNACPLNSDITYQNRTQIQFSVIRRGDNSGHRLGGVCSIQLSYRDIFKIYAIFIARRNRTICRLGGGPSILVRYGGIYEILAFCEQTDNRFLPKGDGRNIS